MSEWAQTNKTTAYDELVKRMEGLEARMRAHFGVMTIVGAVLEQRDTMLVDMLKAYRDRHLHPEADGSDTNWSNKVIGAEVDAILSVIAPEKPATIGIRVIQGGLLA